MTIEAAAGDGAGGEGGGAGGAGAVGAAGGADKGAGGGDAPWFSTFTDEALRTDPTIQRFQGPEDLAKGHVNLLKRFGVDPNLRVELPADPNDAEGMRAVYTRIGLPENPEGYGLVLDEKTATDADKALLSDFTAAAHKLGMPKQFAEGAMAFWMGKVAEANQQAEQAATLAAEQGVAALKQDWGAAYEPKLREIGAALTKYGDPELQKSLEGDNLGRYPNLARMLGKMLDRMAEPGGAGGQSGDGAGQERAMTPDVAKAQLKLVEANPALHNKSDPQHAAVFAERQRLLAYANPTAFAGS